MSAIVRDKVVPIRPGLCLRIVRQYKHGGVIICDSTTLTPDIIARARSMTTQYIDISGRLLGNVGISLRVRIYLAKSLLFTILFYAAHVWTQLPQCCSGKLHCAYLRVCRMVAREFRGDSSSVSDSEVLSMLGLPPIDLALRRARLVYLARLISNGPRSLLALLQLTAIRKDSWPALLVSDICALRRATNKLAALPPVSTHPDVWVTFLRDHQGPWRQLVKLVAPLDVHVDIDDSNGSLHAVVPVPTAPIVGLTCPDCGLAVFKKKALRSHMHRQHGHIAIARRFLASPVCPVCHKTFANIAKAVRHL